MAILRIARFGGRFPSISPRALPDDAGTEADNIWPRVDEFQPRKTDLDLAESVSGAKTIYRHSRLPDGSFHAGLTTGWRANTKALNVAKGQINDNTEDRLYLTAMDGSEVPHLITAAGVYRRVGVPQPQGIPATVVNVVDELTWEERSAGYETALAQAEQAIRASFTEQWVGVPHPGTGTPGVLDVSTTHFSEAVPFMVGRLYRIDGPGGSINNAYSSEAPDVMAWVMDPMLKGLEVGVLSNAPGWAGSAHHYGVGLYAYGRAVSINKPVAAAALAVITLPGGEAMFPPSQITTIVDGLEEVLSHTVGDVRTMKEGLTNKLSEVLGILSGGARSNLIAATQKFYDKPEIQVAFNKALDAFSSEVSRQAKQVRLTPAPLAYGPVDPP